VTLMSSLLPERRSILELLEDENLRDSMEGMVEGSSEGEGDEGKCVTVFFFVCVL
jgi:methanogenic corrinoid protein MtbC1